MAEPWIYETSYLALHPDVRQAVERGAYRSGMDHYEKHGRAEGRAVTRFDPESLSIPDSHSIRDYTQLVRKLIADHPGNLDLAMAKAIGSTTLESFRQTGDMHLHVLRRFGLKNGDAIYDLACGSGRTASALVRHGWQGEYSGADIIPELVSYAAQKHPGLRFFVHPDYSIAAHDNSLDMVYSWSLFTHLKLEEIFLYARDSHRALKPGGIFVFSFLTLADSGHRELFLNRVAELDNRASRTHLDTFLDRSTLLVLCGQMLGFHLVGFIDADDASATPLGSFGQALAIFRK